MLSPPVTEALRAAGEDFRLLLLSDHTTYMANGAHGADPRAVRAV